jgi:hypothetical protein
MSAPKLVLFLDFDFEGEARTVRVSANADLHALENHCSFLFAPDYNEDAALSIAFQAHRICP